jgi:hypothetical protein
MGVETGPDGTYTFGGLVTGTYRVEFFNGWGGYAVEYYDNQTTLRKATNIGVTTGVVTPGIDAALTWTGEDPYGGKPPAGGAARAALHVAPDAFVNRVAVIHSFAGRPSFWPTAWAGNAAR